jgi:FkbM family methyltransferase
LLFVDGSAVAESVKRHFHHDPGVEYFMQKHRDRLFPFFDVGANVGLFSVMAAKMGGPVFAFEPDADNLDLLARNVNAHGVDVRVFPVACAPQDGTLRLGTLPCGRSVKSTANVIELPARSLKSIIAETGVSPAFMKIDIEGGETDALLGFEGAEGWLSTILEVEFSWRDHGRQIGEWLRMRPLTSYTWEFLLSKKDTALPAMMLGGQEFASVTAATADELQEIFSLLRSSTDKRGSRKWELCISPK